MCGLKVGTAEIVVLRDVIPCSLTEKYQDTIISFKKPKPAFNSQTKNILEDSEV